MQCHVMSFLCCNVISVSPKLYALTMFSASAFHPPVMRICSMGFANCAGQVKLAASGRSRGSHGSRGTKQSATSRFLVEGRRYHVSSLARLLARVP